MSKYPKLCLLLTIWWTALSVALGLEIRGEIIKGTPCVKRFNQLFCPTAGNSYPIDRIEEFIDENKALMRRMYGSFQITTEYGPPIQTTRYGPPLQNSKRKRDTRNVDHPPGVPDFFDTVDDVDDKAYNTGSYFSKWRNARQANEKFNNRSQSQGASSRPNVGPNPTIEPKTDRIDACESKIEIVTPYWASNSAGQIRAVVNTQHFEQAIHQEVCTTMQARRCSGDCGCEQKYKWHRLLAYDPDNDCKGIFMDWFLFPSCCVCRCIPD